jgi:DNA-binding transcriptional MerR regulator
MNTAGDSSFTIGELAKEFGLTLRAIRFYEDQKLLHPVRMGTTRHFTKRDRARLAMICRGKRLGFSLKQIRAFLDLYDGDNGQQVEQMRYLLGEARERIGVLQQQQRDLELTLLELRAIEENLVKHLPNLERGELTPEQFRRMVP